MPNPLVNGFCSAAQPRSRKNPWQWCEENVIVDPTSPFPGPFRTDTSPWIREPMETWGDYNLTDYACMVSAQSSKTHLVLGCASYSIGNDPGPSMWVAANRDDVVDFVRDRAAPTFNHCRAIRQRKQSETKTDFVFDGVPFMFRGAGSPGKLQSKPIRYLYLDEVRNYPDGALELALKRTRAFWNAKRFLISTPGKEHDAVHRAYLAGDQRVFHICCPHCAEAQPLEFEQLKWTTDDLTKPNGIWNYDVLASTIRYECKHCNHQITDTPLNRKRLAREGRFIAQNPNAPKKRVSFHWNALLPPWVSWRSVVEEFLLARIAARNGDIEPMRAFINETLGLPWKDELGVIEDFGFLEQRKGDYEYGEAWPGEVCRFMAADRQEKGGEHYYYVIRAVGQRGQSRLLAHGRCNTKAELEEERKRWRVPVANALVDSGWKASEVYSFCVAAGWKPFKGDDAEYFLQQIPNPQRPTELMTVRRVFHRTSVDPMIGQRRSVRRRSITKPLKLFRWSNPAVKDALALYTSGMAGDWTLPSNVAREYLKQMSAERREEKVNHLGRVKFVWRRVQRDNHYFDCELMIMVACIAAKLVAEPRPA